MTCEKYGYARPAEADDDDFDEALWLSLIAGIPREEAEQHIEAHKQPHDHPPAITASEVPSSYEGLKIRVVRELPESQPVMTPEEQIQADARSMPQVGWPPRGSRPQPAGAAPPPPPPPRPTRLLPEES